MRWRRHSNRMAPSDSFGRMDSRSSSKDRVNVDLLASGVRAVAAWCGARAAKLDWASKQCWKRGFSKSRMVQSASDTWETSACLIRASHLRLLRFQRYVRFEESISY